MLINTTHSNIYFEIEFAIQSSNKVSSQNALLKGIYTLPTENHTLKIRSHQFFFY